jgi:hypothetical protein
LKALCAAGFITELRKSHPHRSAAYQVQWNILEEAQRRWELEAFAAMKARRRLRDDNKAEHQKRFRQRLNATDILPAAMRCSRTKRPPLPGQNDPLKGCASPGQNDPLNSIELFELNSSKVDHPRNELGGCPPSPLPCKSRASGGHSNPTTSSLVESQKSIQEGASGEGTESQQAPSLEANAAEENLNADLSRDAAYVAILGWLLPELHAAAVASEMRQRGTGAALVLKAYRTRKEAA